MIIFSILLFWTIISIVYIVCILEDHPQIPPRWESLVTLPVLVIAHVYGYISDYIFKDR